jgi:hypothetical protein
MITLPKGWNNAQLETIFEKHITALTDELAKVLLQLVLDQLRRPAWHVTQVAPAPEQAQRHVHAAKPLNEMAALYDGETRKWRCPHCNNFSDLRRRAVTTHMRSCEGGGVPQAPMPPASVKLKTKRRRTRKAKP